MAYSILPHTADVGVSAAAPDLPELFSEAVRGLAAILLDAEPPSGVEGPTVRVEADDHALLLAALLEEALYVYETGGAPAVGARLDVSEGVAQGNFLLAADARPRGPAVKAVTYHQLEVAQDAQGWRATVYFDV